ncbi:hypothetical protein CJ205_00025 [Dolosicoccus paucivorans]|uniref:ADP-ribosylglycohydrolase n=1 Tax=Dolosicoccus paucivorans TaxID=84521 RepID=A0A2N6SPZ5_9LACT|nr:ADP-ribosylglycohydrolase family protein [Dolosicoccus paucivorans]PMC59129.1 hypothetical protein CJ205_00025 [Dolosicoccus paucivorans]
MESKILGVLYGMAIGDAFGMPPELWSRPKLIKEYGWIDGFLDGHPDNEVSYQYKKGQFTDDTAQALIILDSLIKTDFVPNSKSIATHLLKWAKKEQAFEKNILGPTSKKTLEAFEKNEDGSVYAAMALSNGAAMRIAPIGTLFSPSQVKKLCDYVYDVSYITHSSDVTVAGAAMIAMGVSSVLQNADRHQMIKEVLSVNDYAMSLGSPTASPCLVTRIKYGIYLANKYANNEEQFLQELYNMFAATVNTVDSVPCAIAIAYYSFDVKKAAILSANLGGDTDTVGAMACAICGARGIELIPKDSIQMIDQANNVDLTYYAHYLCEKRRRV